MSYERQPPERCPTSNGDNAMTDNPTGAGHNRLGMLAAEIVEHHRCAGAATREAIRHAIEAGRRLAEAKKLVGHGGWLAWLKENVPGISARTAQRYLAAAERAGKNDTVSFFRLRGLALRSRPKPTPWFHDIPRVAREMGVPARDLWLGAIRFQWAQVLNNVVEIGGDLAGAQQIVLPKQWSLWLQKKIGTTPEAAAVLIEAAGAIKAGQPWDEEAVIDAMMSRERPAA
jgi:hypothetical protein